MKNLKFNNKFRKVVLTFLIILFMLLVFDVGMHQKYGLSDDPQFHMVIVNEIIKIKNLPEKDPQTNLDVMDYPAGYHVWLATIVNLTNLDKYSFVFRYSSPLLAGIIFLLVFVFIRRITNENIAIIAMIILFFAGGIGWLLYPSMLSPSYSGEYFWEYAENTGLYSSTTFLSRLIYPTSHAAGIVLLILFLYLFNRKKYFSAAILLTTLSYTHRNTFVFTSLLLIPLMISLKKEEAKAVLMPVITLIFSFGWNFYPRLTTLFGINIPNIINTENILRLFLLISIVLFFVLNRKLKKSIFKLTLLVIVIAFVFDIFFHFNNTMPFEINFYKILFFLYGPLLIGLFFIQKFRYSNEIYCLLITGLVLTQSNSIFAILNPQRILIYLFIPLSVMYATMMYETKKRLKIILMLLLVLVLVGGFWKLNFYTLERSFNDNIDYYNASLTFIRDNLAENSRIITSPGFDLGKRISIIIPSIAERYIYTRLNYWGFGQQETLISKEFKDSGFTLDVWENQKKFLYERDIPSRLYQVEYLFKNPDMNISGTKIEELATHILGVKRSNDCQRFRPYYPMIYEDDKVCIFEINKTNKNINAVT